MKEIGRGGGDRTHVPKSRASSEAICNDPLGQILHNPLEFLLGGSWVPEGFNLYRRASSRIPKYLACSFRQRLSQA